MSSSLAQRGKDRELLDAENAQHSDRLVQLLDTALARAHAVVTCPPCAAPPLPPRAPPRAPPRPRVAGPWFKSDKGGGIATPPPASCTGAKACCC